MLRTVVSAKGLEVDPYVHTLLWFKHTEVGEPLLQGTLTSAKSCTICDLA